MKVQALDASTGEMVEIDYVPSPNENDVPLAPVPDVVSRFQARASLLEAGLLEDAEEAMSGATPIAKLAWAEATEWRRDSPTIGAIGDALGLTAIQIDDLFRYAATIRA